MTHDVHTENRRRNGSGNPGPATAPWGTVWESFREGLWDAGRDWAQDLRFSARSLLRTPAFTLVAVLTLALGVGANTTVFSAFHQVLFAPPPYSEPQELVVPGLALGPPGEESSHWIWSYPYFQAFQDGPEAYSQVAGWAPLSRNLGGIETPERVSLEVVTSNYFATLGVAPALGAGLPQTTGGDPLAARQVILGDGLWRRHFAADQDVLGQFLRLDGHELEIVGVAPPGFYGLSEAAELWVPLEAAPLLTFSSRLSPKRNLSFWMTAVARLKPGVSVEQAHGAMERWIAEILKERPLPSWAAGEVLRGRVKGLAELGATGAQARPLWLLQGAVLLVLLITCANLASLLLGRSLNRRGELAMRSVLGASQPRLLRLLLAESAILALLGGTGGLLISLWGLGLLQGVLPPELAPAGQTLALTPPVLAANFAVAALAALSFGLAPAWRASRQARQRGEIGAAAPGILRGGSRLGARPLLVATEIALAMVLLVFAGLLLRSLDQLLREDVGFAAEELLTAKLSLPRVSYSGDTGPAFFDRLLERTQALPGVVSASVAACLPGAGFCDRTHLKIDGWPEDTPAGDVALNIVDPQIFRTLGMPVLQGRAFESGDRDGGPRVAVINEAAARRWWPGKSPLGQRVWAGVGWGPPDDWAEVVGVVPDVRYEGAREGSVPRLYVPYSQFWYHEIVLALRVHGAGSSLAPSLRAAVAELDPNLPVFDLATMETLLAKTHAATTFGGTLVSLFAALALLLAAIGVYGVMAFATAARRREVGIRMALGATGPAVLRLLLKDAFRILALGAAAGLTTAILGSRLLEADLYGVSPRDPVTYGLVLVVLAAVALLAATLPALRATRIDPAATVRGD